MKLTFLGAAHEVTGSCTLLEACGKKILIDCGMEQGADLYENCEIPLPADEIDYIFLTHAHIDHSGKIPAMTAQGFQGKIYLTGATDRLCRIMLMDSAHIQESEAEWRNRKAKRSGLPAYVPPYTIADAQRSFTLFCPCNYQIPYSVTNGISIRFLDAGHLLGSASIEITVTENNTTQVLLFSGDVGNVDRPLIRNPQKPTQADYVIVESTYGDRNHKERKDYVAQLTDIITRTLDRGGNVVIPAFAIGRTQELLYLIQEIKTHNLVPNHPDFPVWVDSPLAIEATSIYDDDAAMHDYYDDHALSLLQNGKSVLRFNGLHTSVTSEESKAINFDPQPKVILSASGMCEAGRIRHHLKHNLWKNESTILFVGYQSNGTLGRILLDGAKQIKLFGETVQVHAEIATMDGISGHADQTILLDWLAALQTPPRRVFVNHGDDTVCDLFAEQIHTRLQFDATAPYNGAVYDLSQNVCLNEGSRTALIKSKARARDIVPAYDRLLAAGKRLLSILEGMKEQPGKKLNKLTNQILSLIDRWEH